VAVVADLHLVVVVAAAHVLDHHRDRRLGVQPEGLVAVTTKAKEPSAVGVKVAVPLSLRTKFGAAFQA
jgi:hypothetical protein